MKVWLNLLPRDKKDLVERKRFDRFLFRQAVLFTTVVLFYLSILFGIFLMVRQDRVLTESAYRESADLSVESRELSRFEESFREANGISDRVNGFTDSHPEWSGFLSRLNTLVPRNVILTSLTTNEYRIFVSGEASTREDFLAFESSLKGDDCLSGFETPVSNLFSEKNVVFQIDFTVRPDCLTDIETR